MTPFIEAWAAAIFRAAWQGGVVILIVLFLTSALPALPPAWRCWLWRGGFAKLLLALAFTGAITVPLLPPPQPPVSPGPVAHPLLAAPDDSAAPSLTPPVTAAPEAPFPSLSTALFTLWALGLLVYLARLIHDHTQVARLRRRAVPTRDRIILDVCAQLSRRLNLPRAPEVLVSHETQTPLLVGILRPAIILPAEAGGPLSARADPAHDSLRMMLAHELAHLKRRDLAWNWLPVAAHALFWFHPLAALAARELRLAQESACDALAISATGTPPRAYGAMLLDAIAAVRTPPRLPRAGAAAVVETRSSVQRRLAAMNHFRPAPPSRRAHLAALLLLAALLAPAAVPWKLVAQSAPAKGDASADAAKGAAPAAGDAAPASPAGPTTPTRPAGEPDAPGLFGAPGQPVDPPSTTRYVGVVVAPTVDLGVSAGGIVSEVPVKEGDAVKKGQLLLRLDGTAQEAAVIEAEASFELQMVRLKRRTDLLDRKNATASEVREAQAELRVAEARLRAAKHALSLTQVTAPFDGVLSDVAARPGMLVGNKPVATLVEVSAPSVSIHVPQHLIGKLKTGQGAAVSVYPLPDETFSGHVSVISPVMRAGSGTVAVAVRLDDPGGKVRPGMQAKVQFEGI